MILRNKKTGDIWEFEDGFEMKASYETAKRAGASSGILTCYAGSLAELNEDWEDYEPAEPLIKDEKIRKAVRAWAEADGADEKIYLTIDENGSRFANKYGGYIEFGFMIDMEEGLYTITELCGEDKE